MKVKVKYLCDKCGGYEIKKDQLILEEEGVLISPDQEVTAIHVEDSYSGLDYKLCPKCFVEVLKGAG